MLRPYAVSQSCAGFESSATERSTPVAMITPMVTVATAEKRARTPAANDGPPVGAMRGSFQSATATKARPLTQMETLSRCRASATISAR